MENRTKSQKKVFGLVQTALFASIIILMALIPFLGYIPLGFTRATIIHIPVILGSVLLGPVKGAFLGAVFGLTSLINNTMNPTVTSFVFSPFYSLGDIQGGLGSLIICFVPRILVGVLPHYVYEMLKKKSAVVSLAAAGLVGSLTNTLLVMNFIFLFFKDAYAQVNRVSVDAVYGFIVGIIAINGVPEAIVAAVLVASVGKALIKSRFVAKKE